MLTGIHFLTTYTCNFECDHCFCHCGPRSRGTFTIAQIRSLLDEAVAIGTIEKVFFEGGEPLLYYPLVLAGIDLARRRGLDSSIVTNGYWATSVEDAELWLRPLRDRGVTSISVTDDSLHYGDQAGVHAERITDAGRKIGVEVRAMAAEPTVGGGVMFRGRAADKLAQGLPTRPADELVTCPHEKLAEPGRVHVDCYGHVHLCQGLAMGNCWTQPLSQLLRDYEPEAHPVVGPLLRGGPAQLAREYEVALEGEYVDECHLCYRVRLALLGRFGQYLAPPQVYGLEQAEPWPDVL